jgi:hypothetical protein
LKYCTYAHDFVYFNQVARTKSTDRPMTSEELAAAGLSPNRDVPHEAEDIHVHESDLDNASARDSESREEGEVGSEEDLGSVEADLRDLVSTKRLKSLPASFNFAESKVTTNMIQEYEAAGYFAAGDGRAPLDEQIPTPAPGEVVVFRDFFTCGYSLRSYASRYFGEIFGGNPSTFAKLILGVVEILLDYENLQVQFQCRCVCKVVRIGH